MAANNQGGSKSNQSRGSNQGGNKQSDTSNRGFASMDPQRQREIASAGGRAAHASGNAHEFTSEEARRAGSMSHKNDGNNQSGSAGGQQGGRNENQVGIQQGGRNENQVGIQQGGRNESQGGGSQQSGRGGNNQFGSGGGQQGGRNENQDGGNQANRGVQGGTPEQHARAGAQSHKNDKR